MPYDTGESTASINRRMDAAAFARALPELRRGALLERPMRLYTWYANRRGGITGRGIARLLKAGAIVQVGHQTYSLAPGQREQS